jgi:LPXTG-site transpeptidase (sortase) family protein
MVQINRRTFLGLALAGLTTMACQKQQVVYVSAPTPTPHAAPEPSAPTAPPAPTAVPAVAPPAASKPAAQGPIQLPVPVAAGPAAALSAQSQVMPPIQPRTRPYTNRLEVPERLQIPAIDLDSKVVPIGTKTDDRGRILWETAAFAVGHHKGTGLPGEAGNVVLSGHISSPREGNVFNKLPQVTEGDGIVVSTSDRQYLYVVKETKTVTPDAVDVLDPTDQSILTMITCVPDGIYSHRLIVRAEAV